MKNVNPYSAVTSSCNQQTRHGSTEMWPLMRYSWPDSLACLSGAYTEKIQDGSRQPKDRVKLSKPRADLAAGGGSGAPAVVEAVERGGASVDVVRRGHLCGI